MLSKSSGKIYEYLKTGKPILALTDEGSASARLIRKEGVGWVCDSKNEKKIEIILREILEKYGEDKLHLQVNQVLIRRYDRRKLTERLSKVFDNLLPYKD